MSLGTIVLGQGSANCFCKGPDSKYVQLCRLCGNCSPLPLEWSADTARDDMQTNGQGRVLLTLYKNGSGRIWPRGHSWLPSCVPEEQPKPSIADKRKKHAEPSWRKRKCCQKMGSWCHRKKEFENAPNKPKEVNLLKERG